MYDELLEMMEHEKDSVSFYTRMEALDKFFDKHGLYERMYLPQPDVPMSFIWAVTANEIEMFTSQIGVMSQFRNIFNPNDQFIFVCDHQLTNKVKDITAGLREQLNSKVVSIRRGVPGDRPTLNWDIGIDYAEHDRMLFIRDVALFFQPYELISAARSVDITNRLVNFSVVLGPVWSRFTDRWSYLVHSKYAPTPFMFVWVARKQDILSINGFDLVFRRGYDHMGELDFLLRWSSAGLTYDICDEGMVLYPGIAADQDKINEMQYQSSICRRYFFDRYGEDFINNLDVPFKADLNLIEVSHALTLSPLSYVLEDKGTDIQLPFKPHDFAKLTHDKFVITC
jgi:hypothetical protein